MAKNKGATQKRRKCVGGEGEGKLRGGMGEGVTYQRFITIW